VKLLSIRSDFKRLDTLSGIECSFSGGLIGFGPPAPPYRDVKPAMGNESAEQDKGRIAMSIKIILADDFYIIRQAQRRILETEPDFEVIGEARNGRELIQLV